jgi:hypothetical protein
MGWNAPAVRTRSACRRDPALVFGRERQIASVPKHLGTDHDHWVGTGCPQCSGSNVRNAPGAASHRMIELSEAAVGHRPLLAGSGQSAFDPKRTSETAARRKGMRLLLRRSRRRWSTMPRRLSAGSSEAHAIRGHRFSDSADQPSAIV